MPYTKPYFFNLLFKLEILNVWAHFYIVPLKLILLTRGRACCMNVVVAFLIPGYVHCSKSLVWTMQEGPHDALRLLMDLTELGDDESWLSVWKKKPSPIESTGGFLSFLLLIAIAGRWDCFGKCQLCSDSTLNLAFEFRVCQIGEKRKNMLEWVIQLSGGRWSGIFFVSSSYEEVHEGTVCITPRTSGALWVKPCFERTI